MSFIPNGFPSVLAQVMSCECMVPFVAVVASSGVPLASCNARAAGLLSRGVAVSHCKRIISITATDPHREVTVPTHCGAFSLLKYPLKRGHGCGFLSPALQFIILVVDSTDRERLAISKEELYRMLAHEVRH